MNAMIEFTTVSSEEEVQQILDLQALNHLTAVSEAEKASQGFVTVRHDWDVLTRMNRAAPSVIAKSDGKVVGYCLVMPRSFANDVPVLVPMFEMIESQTWNSRPVNDYRWFVMGQVCVAADFRGAGVFDGMYQKLKEVCKADYDLVITEVAARNTRSVRAHERVGFVTMKVYTEDLTGETWHLIGMQI